MNMILAVDTGLPWLNTLISVLMSYVTPILIVAAVAGMIYAVVVGIKFAKADDKSARDEAKQKLISVIIGIVATVILVALFYFVANNIGPGKMIDPSNMIN